MGFDYSMDIRSWRVIHVGRPGRCHRAPRYAPRSGRRFGESLGRRKTETTRNTRRRHRAVRQTSAQLDLRDFKLRLEFYGLRGSHNLYSTDSMVMVNVHKTRLIIHDTASAQRKQTWIERQQTHKILFLPSLGLPQRGDL